MVIYFLIIIILFILDIYSIYFVSSIVGNLFSLILIFIFCLTGIMIIKNFRKFISFSIFVNLIRSKFFNLNKFSILDLLSNFYILISAILFIFPGFLSDILGILLLVIYFSRIFHTDTSQVNSSIIDGKFKEYKK